MCNDQLMELQALQFYYWRETLFNDELHRTSFYLTLQLLPGIEANTPQLQKFLFSHMFCEEYGRKPGA